MTDTVTVLGALAGLITAIATLWGVMQKKQSSKSSKVKEHQREHKLYNSEVSIKDSSINANYSSEIERIRIMIRINMRVDDFTAKQRDWLKHALAGFLRIPPELVKIDSIEEGSTKVYLTLPRDSAKKLLKAFEENSSELEQSFKPLSIMNIEEKTKEPLSIMNIGEKTKIDMTNTILNKINFSYATWAALAAIIVAAIVPALISSPPRPSLKKQLDKTFGIRNWFCYPQNRTAIGVKQLPKLFEVKSPIKSVDNDNGTYGKGETAYGDCGSSLELELALQSSDIPLWQSDAIQRWKEDEKKWKSQRRKIIPWLNETFGETGWKKNDKYNFSAIIEELREDLQIKYPITSVDVSDGSTFFKHGVGEEPIIAGQKVRIWFVGVIKN